MHAYRIGCFAILLFMQSNLTFAAPWKSVLEMKGSTNEKSQMIDLAGNEVLSWAYASKDAAYLSVTIVGSENHLIVNRLDRTESDTTTLHLPAGRYHVDVRASGCTWAVSILRTPPGQTPEQLALLEQERRRRAAEQKRMVQAEQTRLRNAAVYRWKNSNPPPKRDRVECERREWFSSTGDFLVEGALVGVTKDRIKIRRDDTRNPRIRTYGKFPHFIEIERSKLSTISNAIAERVYEKVEEYHQAYSQWQSKSAAAKRRIAEKFVTAEDGDKVRI